MKTNLLLCGLSPMAMAGMRVLLEDAFAIHEAEALPLDLPAGVIVVDVGLGVSNIVGWLRSLRPANVVVWGGVSPAVEMLLLKSGARGILETTALFPTVRRCVRQVADGKIWTENAVPVITDDCLRSLTPRQVEVLRLIQQGMSNEKIADELFIRPGTVKIHVRRIFLRVGVSDRNELILAGIVAAAEERRKIVGTPDEMTALDQKPASVEERHVDISTVVVNDQTTIMLTTPGENNRTCVYVSLEEGKLVFSGGSSIVERIEGEGWRGKIAIAKNQR